MYLSIRESMEKKGVHRAKTEIARACLLSCTRDVLQEPGDFRTTEIGVQYEPCSFANAGLESLLFQRIALSSGAAVLPDDRIVDGASALSLPEQGRFSLIGNTNCCN